MSYIIATELGVSRTFCQVVSSTRDFETIMWVETYGIKPCGPYPLCSKNFTVILEAEVLKGRLSAYPTCL